MSKPLNQYVRVPYRGTHYVEAEALDSAIAQIADLEKKLGTHPDQQGGPLEAPAESTLQTEEEKQKDQEEADALDKLIALSNAETHDGEWSPIMLLNYVTGLQGQIDAHEQEKHSWVATTESLNATITTANQKIADLDKLIAAAKTSIPKGTVFSAPAPVVAGTDAIISNCTITPPSEGSAS